MNILMNALSAHKGGILTYTQNLKTKFSEALWGNEPILERFLQHIPLNRVGTSDDIAGLAVYLASDAAAYCTGGVYLIDGGYAAT